MRILWLCNIMLPIIAKELGVESSHKEGWLTGTLNRIQEKREDSSIILGICYPTRESELVVKGSVEGISYYGFYEDVGNPEKYDASLEENLREIVNHFQPDLIHIFGTEYAHSYAMVQSVVVKDKLMISMQGLCGLCAKEYYAGLPKNIYERVTLRDWLKKDSIVQQKKKFWLRGKREVEVLKNITHVLGRTRADYEYTKSFHQNVNYYHLNETLRKEFYQEEWELVKCKRNTILITQADYPLKGFHFLLMALPEIIKRFPTVRVRVTGNCITRWSTWKDKLKISAYGLYLRELIEKNHLEGYVEQVGMVSSEEMCALMLDSHILVSCSVMENSPNSIGESMLLGLPVVASNVGGIPSMVEDKKEAMLYETYIIEDLVDKICKVLGDDEMAVELSINARKRAKITHHMEENYKRLVEIYHQVKEERG
ncbi:MAG: glycosyltransferase [Eubacteriales bacterium]